MTFAVLLLYIKPVFIDTFDGDSLSDLKTLIHNKTTSSGQSEGLSLASLVTYLDGNNSTSCPKLHPKQGIMLVPQGNICQLKLAPRPTCPLLLGSTGLIIS